MNVGLPGTGLGGLFYLVTALLMPVIELVRTLRGERSLVRWRVALRQAGLAASVFGSLWLSAKLVEVIVPRLPMYIRIAVAGATAQAGRDAAGMLGVTPTVLTVAVLIGIVVGVEMLRIGLMVWQGRKHAPVGSTLGVFVD